MPEDDPAPGRDRYARTFEVLELLVGRDGGMTVTEIGTRLGLPISSSHDLLQRMLTAEVLTVSGDLRYSPGPRAVRLGIRIADGLDVRAVARPHLEELSRSTGDDVYLAVRLGGRVAYVDRVHGTHPVSVDIRLGQSLFLHATAVGKLFAAHDGRLHERMVTGRRPALTGHTLTEPADLDRELARIREQGHAVSREEAIVGVIGLAVPVRDRHGEMVAAVHVSTLRAGVTEQDQARLVGAATVAAAAVEHDMGR